MNRETLALFEARDSADRQAASAAFVSLMQLAKEPVEWAYDVWDDMVRDLSHKEGHKRAFAAQMLAHLAISDPDGRMLRDFPTLAAVMKDEKTVTARHTLQNIWRVGLAGPKQAKLVREALARRFEECLPEKNGSLVRTDVITALGQWFQRTGDAGLEALAERLMDSEQDPKAQSKQRSCWRKASASSDAPSV